MKETSKGRRGEALKDIPSVQGFFRGIFKFKTRIFLIAKIADFTSREKGASA